MIIKEQKIMDVYSNDDNAVELKVSANKSAKLFNILIESYKNPRTSMMREYVSNAWDAHKALGHDNTKPVVVRFSEDDAGQYVEIIDKGVGMSKDFFYNTYSNLLETTKEDSNEEIGGFGIGSKTALAYTNYYYVTSVKDGYKNSFAVYRESSQSPKIAELMSESTDEESGTTVKIYLKEKSDELSVLTKATIKELCYFDNVVIEYAFDLNNQAVSDYNNAVIIEGKTFKFKNFANSSLYYDESVHIVLGQVAYTIDYRELGLNEGAFRFPVALKFDIGDLQVHMNRETIIYTDESKELIRNRLDELKKELVELYTKHTSQVKPFNNLQSYFKKVKDVLNTEYMALPLVKISDWNTAYIYVKRSLLFGKSKEEEILKSENIRLSFERFIPKLDISIIRNEKAFGNLANSIFYVVGSASSGKVHKRISTGDVMSALNMYNKVVIVKSSQELDRIMNNKMLVKYLNSFVVIRQNKPGRSFNVNSFLKQTYNKRVGIYNDDYYGNRKIVVERSDKHLIHSIGNVIKTKAFVAIAKREILKNSFIIPANVKVPEEYIKEVKELEKANRAKIYRAEGVIPVKSISRGYVNNREFNLKILNNYKGIVVYGTKNERFKLELIEKLLSFRFDELTYTKKEQAFKVMQVAANNQMPFTKFPNTVDANIFFMSNHKIITQVYTANYIEERYMTVYKNNLTFITNINTKVGKALKTLGEYSEKHHPQGALARSIVRELKFIETKMNLIDNNLKEELDLVEKFFDGVEFLLGIKVNDYLNVDIKSDLRLSDLSVEMKNIVKILKASNKRLNWNLYVERPPLITLPIKKVQETTRFVEQEYEDLLNYNRCTPKPMKINSYINNL